jgi:hypothetical protein
LGNLDSGELPTVVPWSSGDVARHTLSPDLARVVSVWQHLPEAIRAGILALVETSCEADQRTSRSG